MEVSLADRIKLRKFVKNLKRFRGRHTELVSVYVPAGYDLTKIIGSLEDEKGTATNIKDAKTSKSVISSLERMIRTLRVIDKTPPNGLAIFSGNVSQKDNVDDFQVFWIEPFDSVGIKLYRCDQRFVTAPLEEMDSSEITYGLIVIDKGEATVGLLRGSSIKVIRNMHSTVPGKFKAGGQCLVKDSFVQFSNGSINRIDEVKKKSFVKSMNGKSLVVGDSVVTDRWNVGKNKVYKFVTKNPRFEIECSSDHVFFCNSLTGVKNECAENLRVGDELLFPERIFVKGKQQKLNSGRFYNSYEIGEAGRNLIKGRRIQKKLEQNQLAKKIGVTQTTISSYEIGKLNANREQLKKLCLALDVDFLNFLEFYCKPKDSVVLPNFLTCDLAQVLGYFAGDGNFEKERITFSEQREEVAKFYEKLIKKVFRGEVNFKFRENKGYYQIRAYGKAIVRLMKEEFCEVNKAKDTLIPQRVLKSGDEVLSAFVKGFFDAEGYTSTRGNVSFGINNKFLAMQFQMALLRFGIIASLYEYDNKRNPYSKEFRYTVDITEKESLERFLKIVGGFTAKDKNEKLKKIVFSKSGKSNVRELLVSGSKIRRIIEKYGYNINKFPKVSGFFRDKRKMSKGIFKESILDVVRDKKLLKELVKVGDGVVLPVKIASVEVVSRNVEMVDISVEKESFVANGLIVHNSAQRFARIREGAAIEFYKRVADVVVHEFTFMKELKGIIVGGPGTTKNNFVDGSYMNEDIKRKIIGLRDITYTNAFGLKELVDKCQDLLSEEEVMVERKVVQRFLETLAKKPGFAVYGYANVKTAFDMGAVDTVIVVESCVTDEQLDELSKLQESTRANMSLVTDRTPEGVQLKGLTGVGAILRYPISV